MQWPYPNYNFPSHPQAPSTRQLFSNYGTGFLNGENAEDLESQRLRPNRASVKQYLTAPLNNSPTEVPYPWKDRVMGETIEKNCLLESFTARVQRIIGARKRSSKTREVRELMTAIENYNENPQDGSYENVALNMPSWFSELLEQYEKIRDVKEPKNHNWRYAGGCLVGFQGNELDTGFLITPSGTDFHDITLYQLLEDSSGIARSKAIGSQTLPGSVFEVRGQEIQSQKYLSVRLGSSCLIYSVNVANKENPFTLLRETEVRSGVPTSVSLSPYIQEECLIATDQGQCYMWTATDCDEVIRCHPPRFATEDRWRSCHYGAYPRQIVFADTTVVQTYDLREAESSGHDLFALPNQLLHERERIRLCEGLQQCPFYQFLATDYSLLLMDERFPGHAVLKWDHMLSTPPQYLSILNPRLHSEDCVVYVGSQVPSEIHAFQFRISGDKPPQSISLPWRVDRIRDLLQNPTVIENISNVKALETRFNSSLTGIQMLPWRSGHMVFQLDSHGDIFGQLLEERKVDAHQDQLISSAVQVAKEWVETLESQIKLCIKTSERSVVKDVRDKFEEIQHMRPLCTSCQLCLPSSTSSEISQGQEEAFCLRCCFSVREGRELVEAVKKDAIRSSGVPYSLPGGLVDVDKLPSTSALSRLLLKQWNKDTDIQEELKQWDHEVLEYRKHRRKKKTAQRAGTTLETSVSSRTETSTKQNEQLEPVRIEPELMGSGNESDIDTANQTREWSATNQGANMSLTNQKAEHLPINQDLERPPANLEAEDTMPGQEIEDSSSKQETAISNTPHITPNLNIPNILSQITSFSGHSHSDRSLFSDSEMASGSPRKRRRRLSQSSSVSLRSDISQASVQSFPGFLESPKHLKSSQNVKSSPSSKTMNISQEAKMLENPERRTTESDIHERFSPDPEFSDIFTQAPSFFRSPNRASVTPLTKNRSPIGKLSMSPAKVRKKGYQPGF